MRDSRAFHIDDPRFIEWYNKQGKGYIYCWTYREVDSLILVIFEAQQSNAWVEGDPELIIREAKVRLQKKGWDDLRPALATTIRLLRLFSMLDLVCDGCLNPKCRAYIMRGFMENVAQGSYSAGVQFMSWALEIVEWGA